MKIFDSIIQSLPVLIQGAVITVEITAISVLLGTMIGLIASLGRLSKARLSRILAGIYVDFIRGTPLLVQIFIIYFGIPAFMRTLTGEIWRVNDWVAAITACSINSGAYIAEIFRSGIQSIDRGQMEAARSLGMTHRQAMLHIILPQAFKRVIPPLGNEFIAMLKDTSLLAVIGIAELTRRGQLIVAVKYNPFEIYLMVAFIYLIMTLSISRWVAYMERRLQTSDYN